MDVWKLAKENCSITVVLLLFETKDNKAVE